MADDKTVTPIFKDKAAGAAKSKTPAKKAVKPAKAAAKKATAKPKAASAVDRAKSVISKEGTQKCEFSGEVLPVTAFPTIRNPKTGVFDMRGPVARKNLEASRAKNKAEREKAKAAKEAEKAKAAAAKKADAAKKATKAKSDPGTEAVGELLP